MKLLTTAKHPGPGHTEQIQVYQWQAGDEFPELGPTVGVDTETELITDTMLAPPLVVLGVYDGLHHICYISYWGEDATQFMRELCKRNIQQRYFNLGFDEMVLDDHDPERPLIEAIEAGRVRDMQIRIHLHAIATLGWIPNDRYNLADCSKRFLGIELDKGDPNDPEHAARLTFRRFRPDGSRYVITTEQAGYLAYDCLATWMLGNAPTVQGIRQRVALEEQPTEIQHTKGMVVLANISRNGLEVDMRIFNALTDKLMAERDKQRVALLAYGFPDPYKNQESSTERLRTGLLDQLRSICRDFGIDERYLYSLATDPETGQPLFILPGKNKLRLMVLMLANFADNPDEVDELVDTLIGIYADKERGLRKAEQAAYNEILEDHELLVYDTATKGAVMVMLVALLLREFNKQAASGTLRSRGFDFATAAKVASEAIDAQPELTASGPVIGPRKFFQQHVHQILQENPTLELETTPKSGDVKLTLKDMWRLSDLGISDPFLTAYTAFNHAQKYLSTYLNPQFIKEDHRVHPRFTNILRTGRTSCSAPNILNKTNNGCYKTC